MTCANCGHDEGVHIACDAGHCLAVIEEGDRMNAKGRWVRMFQPCRCRGFRPNLESQNPGKP